MPGDGRRTDGVRDQRRPGLPRSGAAAGEFGSVPDSVPDSVPGSGRVAPGFWPHPNDDGTGEVVRNGSGTASANGTDRGTADGTSPTAG